jgi:hypothetical protein
MGYYTNAMKLVEDILSEEKHFNYYITTDDITWCMENFKDTEKRSFHFLDLTLKTDREVLSNSIFFRNYIISNSSFHWWSSLLSIHNNSTIIAPDLWIKEEGFLTIYTDKMLVIDRSTENRR